MHFPLYLKYRFKSIVIYLFYLWGGVPVQAQPDPLYYTPGEDLSRKSAKYLFLKVETSKKEAFAGESIVAWYRLYVAVDIQGKLSKSPSFSGFASYDMEDGNADAYEVKKINGVSFRVYQVKKVQLFGLRPGIQRLEPVELEASIRYRKIPREINDFLPSSGNADTVINFSVKSSPVDIAVKKLPPDPSGLFSGGVGNFGFTGFASKDTIEAGQADTLHWVLNGSGNWHEIKLPSAVWPPGTEVFEPFGSENLNKDSIPLKGSRSISYPVVFSKKGHYQIAPVEFSIFNPVTRQYQTLRSDTLHITVADARSDDIAASPKKQVNFTALFSRYAIIIFPVAAFGLIILLIYKRRKP